MPLRPDAHRSPAGISLGGHALFPVWVFLSLAVSAVAGCTPVDLPAGDAELLDAATLDAELLDAELLDVAVSDATVADAAPDAGPLDCPACDDSNPCTQDVCDGEECLHLAQDARCEAGERCSGATGCVPQRCTRDAHCSDGLWCTGVERCDATAPTADPGTDCVAGTPLDCRDGVRCTDDACDEAARGCRPIPNDAYCDDDISCTRDVCGGAGTDLNGCSHTPDDAICAEAEWCYPGAYCVATEGCRIISGRDCSDTDPCTYDSCDSSVRSCVNDPWDYDRDGFAARMVGPNLCPGTDCSDRDPYAHPGAPEVCDGADDDCDSIVDEACDTPPDTCASARLLEGAWPIAVSGRFDRLTRELSLPCHSGDLDAFYAVDVATPSDVRVQLDEGAAGVSIAISTSNRCGTGAFGDACARYVDSTDPAPTVLVHGFEPNPDGSPQRVYIAVQRDTRAVLAESFGFRVWVTPRASSDCTTPIDLELPAHVVGRFAASDVNAYVGLCAGTMTGGREHVYRVVPDAEMIRAEVSFATFVDTLSVHSESCSSAAIQCVLGNRLGGHTALIERAVPAGVPYLVVVDRLAAVADYYTLRID